MTYTGDRRWTLQKAAFAVKRMAVYGFLSAILLVGCDGVRPIFVGETVFTVQTPRGGNQTVYSDLDPRMGEVVFSGGSAPVVTEADVEIDEKHVLSLHSGGWASAYVRDFGQHTFLAKVYLMRGTTRTDYIGCARGRFTVDPKYRTSRMMGMWWRLEIPAPSSQC